MLIVIMLILAGMTGCKKSDSGSNPTSSTPPPAAANTVTMQNTAFSPAAMTVAAGTTVTWTNNDNMAHTVTSGAPGAPDGMFDSGTLAAGGTFHFTFATKGTFQYYCTIHAPGMKGTITVQ
jgi:manganese oxidase